MGRVPASERTRNEPKDMLAGKAPADRSRLVRQAARRIVVELGLREMTGRGRFRAWGVL